MIKSTGQGNVQVLRRHFIIRSFQFGTESWTEISSVLLQKRKSNSPSFAGSKKTIVSGHPSAFPSKAICHWTGEDDDAPGVSESTP
jgi:hypothetical protein